MVLDGCTLLKDDEGHEDTRNITSPPIERDEDHGVKKKRKACKESGGSGRLYSERIERRTVERDEVHGSAWKADVFFL